jgi:hypothetical protein
MTKAVMTKAVEIKGNLIREAMEITGAATEGAVESYVAQRRKRRSRKSMFDLVGKVRLRDDYDHKALRAGDADARRRHAALLDLVGKIRFCDGYDPRALRFSEDDED